MTLILLASDLYKELKDSRPRNELEKLFDKNYMELTKERLHKNEKMNTLIVVLKCIAAFKYGPVGIKEYISLFKKLVVLKTDNHNIDLSFSVNSFMLEIENATLEDCLEVIPIINSLNDPNFDSIPYLIETKLASYVFDFVSDSAAIEDPSEFLGRLRVINKAIKADISIHHLVEVLFSVCCDYLYRAYEISDDRPKDPQIVSEPGPSNMILLMKPLRESVDDLYQKKFDVIVNSIQNPLQDEPEILNPIQDIPEDIINDDDNLQNLIRSKKNEIKSFRNQAYQLKIFQGVNPRNGSMFAVKQYYDFPRQMEEAIHKEVEILKEISKLANDDNCFMKLYGCDFNDNCIDIYMEYHPNDLKDQIKSWKTQNQKPNNEYLIKTFKKLIECFSILKSLKINHKDIKPQNLLLTINGNIKVIDFNVSVIDQNEFTYDNPVIGTRCYMPPELIELMDKGVSSANFNPEKADVFSLGLTFLEIVTLQGYTETCNRNNHEKILERVQNCDAKDWIKKLLNSMLKLDPRQRKSFRELIEIVPVFEATEINLY